MRTTHTFILGDRVIWTESKGRVWLGTVTALADDHTLVVRWDRSGKETIAPAWSRRLRHEVTNWTGDTLTQPEGW